MDNGFLTQRKSLIDRVNTWIASKDGKPVLVISAENGTGKTSAIKEVIKSRKFALYYEFSPGQLRKNQDAQNCLVSIYLGLTATLRLEEYETGNESRKSRPNPTTLDPSTLLLRCIALPLAKIKSSNSQNALEEPVVVVVDGLDRCEASSRRTLSKLLLQTWSKQVIGSLVRLVVITSQKVDEREIDKKDVEIITRLASKGSERDEVINAYFEDILKQRGEDVEWETEKLDTLTRSCNGSLLLAQYITKRNLLLERNNLPRSFKEVMEQEYQPWFAPFLCSRDPLASIEESNVELLLDKASVSTKERDERFSMLTWMVANPACIDWFCNSNKERLRMEGHSKAAKSLVQHIRSNDYALKHAVFHAMESGEAEIARCVFVEFDLLFKLALFDASQLLIDLDAYCSKRQQDMTVRVVRNCLMQAKRGLLHDPRQLPFQLLGRITGLATDARGDVEITNLLNACRQFRSKDFFWFRPIRASLPLVPETTMRVLRGHSDSVLCASTSSLDSLWPRMALTGSCDGTAKLWDIMTGKCELTLDCKGAGYVSGVALAVLGENELVALTCTEDGIARMWHITRTDGVYSLGAQLVVSNKNENHPVGQDQQQEQNRKEPSIEDLVSPSPKALLIGHEKELTAGAFVPGSHTLCATASVDKTVRLWELPQPSNADKEDPKCLHVLKGHESAVLCVAFIPESFELIASGSKDRTIRIWSCKRGTCLSTFGGHISNITSIAFRSDGNVFATGGWDSIVKIWTVAEAMNAQLVDPGMNEDEDTLNNRVKEKCMLVHKDWVWSVTFVEGNRDLVVTGTDNGVVRIWSISTSQCVLAFDAHFGVGIYCMSAIGSEYLVTAGMDATLRLFDISPARLNMQSNLLGFESWTSLDAPHRFQGEVLSAAFPAQTLSKRLGIFSALDKSIRAFDLNTGRCIKRLDSTKAHSAPVTRLLVSDDENHLRSIDETGKVTNWNRLTLEPSEDVSFLASCFPCLSAYGRFYDTGYMVSSADGPGHFLPPDSIYDDLSISDEPGERLPFIPVTFDTMLPLNCWLSPPPPNQADDGPFIEGVIVVTEKNGLVHVLHPMI